MSNTKTCDDYWDSGCDEEATFKIAFVTDYMRSNWEIAGKPDYVENPAHWKALEICDSCWEVIDFAEDHVIDLSAACTSCGKSTKEQGEFMNTDPNLCGACWDEEVA